MTVRHGTCRLLFQALPIGLMTRFLHVGSERQPIIVIEAQVVLIEESQSVVHESPDHEDHVSLRLNAIKVVGHDGW